MHTVLHGSLARPCLPVVQKDQFSDPLSTQTMRAMSFDLAHSESIKMRHQSRLARDLHRQLEPRAEKISISEIHPQDKKVAIPEIVMLG